MPQEIDIPDDDCDCCKILIVDDNEFNLYTQAMLLQVIDPKFTSETANNGQSAIEMVVKKHDDETCNCDYKLIIMDCNMPVMDGFQATKLIKEMIARNEIPDIIIAACTAAYESLTSIPAFGISRFDEFLKKPIQTQ